MRLILLSDAFYDAYGHFPEVLEKRSRPYVCLEVCIDGMRFAVPFRHHISHKYALLTGNGGGLDFTKAVVLENGAMISYEQPRVEQAEYDFIKTREKLIESGMRRYYKLVQNALRYPDTPRYATILRYSALKYFL